MHNTLWRSGLPALALVACDDGSTVPPPNARDTIPPAIVELSPGPDATGVPVGSSVRVTFSEPLNWATVATASFFLTRRLQPVPATYAFDRATATLVPDADLDTLTTYTATLTGAVRDSAGNRLPRDTTWSFTTGVPSVPAGARPSRSACRPPACGTR